MSDAERTGRRDLLYSRWHRPAAIRRYVGAVKAAQLEMIDLDSLESCPICHMPLALGETKNSLNDPAAFTARNTVNLANEAKVPAFVVCYSCTCGVTGQRHETADDCDIAEFRVRQVAPEEGSTIPMRPNVYAYWLHAFRTEHYKSSGCSPRAGE